MGKKRLARAYLHNKIFILGLSAQLNWKKHFGLLNKVKNLLNKSKILWIKKRLARTYLHNKILFLAILLLQNNF